MVISLGCKTETEPHSLFCGACRVRAPKESTSRTAHTRRAPQKTLCGSVAQAPAGGDPSELFRVEHRPPDSEQSGHRCWRLPVAYNASVVRSVSMLKGTRRVLWRRTTRALSQVRDSGEPTCLPSRVLFGFPHLEDNSSREARTTQGDIKQFNGSLVSGQTDAETYAARAVALRAGNELELQDPADRALGLLSRHDSPPFWRTIGRLAVTRQQSSSLGSSAVSRREAGRLSGRVWLMIRTRHQRVHPKNMGSLTSNFTTRVFQRVYRRLLSKQPPAPAESSNPLSL